MSTENSLSIVIMALEKTPMGAKFENSNMVGIGGVTSIRNDLFKISLEEAITFLESFKDSVDEKLTILHEISKCKKDVLTKSNSDELQQNEKKATLVFEVLQKNLQHWLFGKGGISLTKCEN